MPVARGDHESTNRRDFKEKSDAKNLVRTLQMRKDVYFVAWSVYGVT
jgi:hypothetical protein